MDAPCVATESNHSSASSAQYCSSVSLQKSKYCGAQNSYLYPSTPSAQPSIVFPTTGSLCVCSVFSTSHSQGQPRPHHPSSTRRVEETPTSGSAQPPWGLLLCTVAAKQSTELHPPPVRALPRLSAAPVGTAVASQPSQADAVDNNQPHHGCRCTSEWRWTRPHVEGFVLQPSVPPSSLRSANVKPIVTTGVGQPTAASVDGVHGSDGGFPAAAARPVLIARRSPAINKRPESSGSHRHAHGRRIGRVGVRMRMHHVSSDPCGPYLPRQTARSKSLAPPAPRGRRVDGPSCGVCVGGVRSGSVACGDGPLRGRNPRRGDLLPTEASVTRVLRGTGGKGKSEGVGERVVHSSEPACAAGVERGGRNGLGRAAGERWKETAVDGRGRGACLGS